MRPIGETNAGLEWMRVFRMKAITTFYRRVLVVARDLEEIPDLQTRLAVRISILTEDDLPAYKSFRPEQDVRLIRARHARGDRAFVVWHEGRIVHAGWVATRRAYIPYLRRDIILNPGDIFLYDHYTLPAFRGKSLANARGVYVLRHYKNQGYRRSLGIVAVENRAAYGPVRSVGYSPIGQYVCIRLAGRHWCWQRAWGEEPLPAMVAPESSDGI